MSKFWIGAAVGLSLLCGGCGESEDQFAASLKAAINPVLVWRQIIIPAPGEPSRLEDLTCVIAAPRDAAGTAGAADAEQKSFQRQLTYAQLLQSSGVLELRPGPYQDLDAAGRRVTRDGYVITFKKKYLGQVKKRHDGQLVLVVGHIGVADIVSVTPPQTRDGKTRRTVNYTRTLVGRAEWATDAVLKYARIDKHLQGVQAVDVEKTPGGWKVIGYSRPMVIK